MSDLQVPGNKMKIKEALSRPVALWLAIFVILLGFGGGVLAGGSFQTEKIIIKGVEAQTPASPEETGIVANKTTSAEAMPAYLKKDVNFNLFWQTWQTIKDRAYDKDVPDTKLFYGSLQGMVASLGDPYSVFMTPSDATQFQDDLKGNFDGIGAEIAVKSNQLIVVSPLDDSPAMKAGLKPKDWILKINGTSTEGMSSSEAVTLIRGKAGTEVILTVFRDGFKEPKEFKIVRAPITVKSVSLEYLSNGQIAHIKVRQFNDDTVPLLDSAINNITARSGVNKIILDLRGNPGGYLEAAVQMAGEWSGDKVVVSEKNRDGVETPHVAGKLARLAEYRTIVLVDGGSASASEIVAGALKDWGKAKIVGMKTFGKGSVQDLTDLPDGSEIKLTIAKWFTPNGVNIDEQGIEPDVKIDLTEEDYNKDKDPQLDKAVELLK
ncbi:MAG: S41 family peptidase [Candidatus Buchananbacteria bacterium]|jgi:carboxyl-terminal processing protease